MRSIASFTLALVSALAIAAPVRAVELPAETDKTLWCGHAFTIVSGEIKSEDEEMSAMLGEHGAALIEAAHKKMGDTGISAEEIQATSKTYASSVAAEIEGKAEDAKFSYDDCLTLVE